MAQYYNCILNDEKNPLNCIKMDHLHCTVVCLLFEVKVNFHTAILSFKCKESLTN